MTAEHQRFEELAVGHVLGGLDPGAAASFRAHLISCRDCRLRVAELRDIAAGLEVAEREERAEARLRTKVDEGDTPPLTSREPGSRRGATSPGSVVVLLLLAGLLAALLFWNLHLRTRDAALGSLADDRAATLQGLAVGVTAPLDLADGVHGIVVVDGDQVAFSFVGLPEPTGAERLVVWLMGGPNGDRAVLQRLATTDQPGTMSGTVAAGEHEELVVSVEPGRPGPTPRGERLARAVLSGL